MVEHNIRILLRETAEQTSPAEIQEVILTEAFLMLREAPVLLYIKHYFRESKHVLFTPIAITV